MFESMPLLILVERITTEAPCEPCSDALVLPYALRLKTRQRVDLASGRPAGLQLPRGTVLHHGDCLQADTGERVQVVAADEPLSVVCGSSDLLLARVAYHLGNRHVPVQIDPGRLSYLHDHVLDALVAGLGLVPTPAIGSFDPEDGAYHRGHSHSGHHGHDH